MTAIEALRNVSAISAERAARNVGDGTYYFLNERINHYMKYGKTRTEALALARDDQRAQY